MKTRIVTMRAFVSEHLVEGELVHQLECGHVVEAWVRENGDVIAERRCGECERDGVGLDHRTRRAS